MRSLGEIETRRLPDVATARQPFFSPDGRWIGYFDGRRLGRMPADGGSQLTLCEVSGAPRGASWGDDGNVVFASTDPGTGLLQVSQEGGEPKLLTTPDPDRRGIDHVWPSVLPGARGVLFTITSGRPESNEVAVLDLESSRVETLVRGGSQPEYVDGHLLYATAGTLFAAPFDLESLTVVGEPVPVLDRIFMMPTGAANYSVGRDGTLAYLPQDPNTLLRCSLVWRDRDGRSEPIDAPLRAYTIARLSPDGTRVALDIRDQENDIWIWDFERETLSRLTHDPARDQNPVWTPDGRRRPVRLRPRRHAKPVPAGRHRDGDGDAGDRERHRAASDFDGRGWRRRGRPRGRADLVRRGVVLVERPRRERLARAHPRLRRRAFAGRDPNSVLRAQCGSVPGRSLSRL